ncbi:MAG TPA: GTPase ObgE [Nitrospirae bacterium]|nr:GTPase ObgE [Nitrospirota bacterium]
MKFVDYARIHVKAGDGGRGCVSFRREKFIPRGGPDGGDGGRGGHVIIEADPQLYTLLDHKYRKTYKAKNGQHGMGKKMHGRDGEDLVIRVPVGTVVKDALTGEVMADLDRAGSRVIVARGGKGGLGNAHFATPTRQAPRYAQPGQKGEERDIILELKLIADVGLVGLPNAGKSTFISKVSAARPKIADYPFTTLRPYLGVVKIDDLKSFVVADIPGLIKDAHKGAGLGYQFLRHIERTKILLHLVDVSDLTAGDPVENLEQVTQELRLYNEDLLRRPQIIAATKMDIANKEKLKRLEEYCEEKGLRLYKISSLTGEGIRDLLLFIAEIVEQQRLSQYGGEGMNSFVSNEIPYYTRQRDQRS